MKKLFAFLTALTLVWLSVLSCGCFLSCNRAPEVPDPEAGLPAFPKPAEQISSVPLTRTEAAFVQAGNEFAWRLTRKVWEGDTEQKSLILSPLSVQYALGMLGNGADAEVSAKLAAVLGYEGTDAINAFCAKLISDLPKVDTTVTLALANGVLFDERYILMQPFKAAVTGSYDAMVESMPFSDAGAVLKRVNDWCSRHTYGRIKDVLKEVDPAAFMYLMNAIYFNARWQDPFGKGDTKDADFTQLSGKRTRVGMMHRTLDHTYFYAESETVQQLCLPYGNGRYQMVLCLPKQPSDLAACIGNPGTLKGELANVILSLPRFHSAYNTDLKALLAGMGLPLYPYDRLVENPRGIPEISKIIHQADITVDESGSEAAAVTIVEMRDGMAAGPAPQPRTVYFTADHPFIYTIRETSTGVILFTGIYNGD